MDGRQTPSAVDALRAAVDGLLSLELAAVPSVEVAALLTELEVQRRRLEAVDQRVLAETVQRGIAGDYARTGPVDLLVNLLRVSPGEARARVERALDAGPRRALTGERLEPLLPQVAEAVKLGEISAAHTTVISDCVEHLPPAIAHQAAPVAEQLLVEAARHEHPRQLARTAAMLLARLDPDGVPPRENELERRRGFTLVTRRDGSSAPKGLLTAEVTAMWQAILDSLAAPIPSDDGLPDDRSPAQRRHDALAEAAQRLLRSGSLPASGGSPVTVLARTTMTELKNGIGVAVTGHGATVSISTLLQMAADAHVIPVICTETDGVLAYGRGRRLASRGQRLALAARDGGCSFPGCARPAAWTEVHHVTDWADGGNTDIDQMCLLCRYHHREFARRGWQVVMDDGIPHWIPPPWLDPHRKPIRNTAHHLDDLVFKFAA
jgi:hypothetical protein